MEDPNRRIEEPYEILHQVPLVGNYMLQQRLDLNDSGLPDHLNQDITGVPGQVSREILGRDAHFRPLS